MFRAPHTVGLALSLVVAFTIGLPAVGGGPVSGPPASPESLANDAFNSGLKHLNNGDKAELKATTAKGSDIEKARRQAREEYEKAGKDFKKAIGLFPGMYRAHNGLGYVARKAGDYATALEHYDHALKLAPNFVDAIEYRGEAYLGLNRVEDAKQAYLQLFSSDRANADVLMKAMKAWVEKRRADPAGVDPADVAALESWIMERAELAAKTVDMARRGAATGWK